MGILSKNLEIFEAYTSHEQLIQSGYTVKQIITDLFNILFNTLWDMKTNLRKYIVCHPTFDLEKEVFAFQKPDRFQKITVKQGGLKIPFVGVLHSHASGKEIGSYVQNILQGYITNEETLLRNMQVKLLELHKNCLNQGIHIGASELPLMQGVYHSHNLDIENISEKEIRLHCMSNLTLFL